jgi:hypothetical protein
MNWGLPLFLGTPLILEAILQKWNSSESSFCFKVFQHCYESGSVWISAPLLDSEIVHKILTKIHCWFSKGSTMPPSLLLTKLLPKILFHYIFQKWCQSDVKPIRYQFWCTRCAFRLIKSLQWYSGRKSWKSEKKLGIVKEPKKKKPANTVPWNWAKSVER